VPLQPRIGVRALVDQHLHEGAVLGRLFPRWSALASRQPDDYIAHPLRLARLHLQLAADVVALVEQAERRNSLRHRSADLAGGLHHRSGLAGDILGHFRALGFDRRCAALAARQQQQRRDDCGRNPHASGVHAW
jgi:hypothetical protein